MAARSGTKDIFKSPAPHAAAEPHDRDEVQERPRNIPPNSYPTDGFAVEVDGKIKSQHATREAAATFGAELKRKFPVLQVTIYDATAKTRTLVEPAK